MQTTPADTATIERLKLFRLDRDLSYRQLAGDMARRGHPIAFRTLYGLLTAAQPRFYDRTLHKVRLYLDEIEQEGSHV